MKNNKSAWKRMAWMLTGMVLGMAVVGWSQPGREVLTSPDGRLTMVLETVAGNQAVAAGGKLVYEVSFQGKRLVESSALSLELQGQPALGPDVRMVKMAAGQTDETYRLVTGKASQVRNYYNSATVELIENGGNGRSMTIMARAYNDGIAFRYVIPAQASMSELRLVREATEFRISKDPFIYALLLPHFRSMYESEFVKLSASSLSNQGGVESKLLIGLPLLMEVPGVGWMAITEADLRDSTAMYLENPSGGWTSHKFESRLAPRLDDSALAVRGELPYQSAWRVLLVGEEPGRLIESNIITSLNPESAIADSSWICAGKAAWDWWCGTLGPDEKGAFTTGTMKYYVDFAARSGLEYMLVDAGWAARNTILAMNGRVDIPALVEYARARGVKVWIWIGYRETSRQMDEAFGLFEKWGVAGVKIDFIERDDQEGIAFYYRVAEKAAQHKLMVDFHGCTKPFGMERTWPNVMGYEAVLGMEQSKAGSRDNPDHHVMLPFTRMLAGRMDYTPGGFDNCGKADFEPRMQNPMVMGTRAHHLAMYVVYEAVFQMVSDHPSAYEGQAAFDFIKEVPATWDETRVLGGQPGEHITIARRRGEEWFVGSMTNWQPRQVEIKLDFLREGNFAAEIYADGPEAEVSPRQVVIKTQAVDRTMTLPVRMAAGGGYALRLRPAR